MSFYLSRYGVFGLVLLVLVFLLLSFLPSALNEWWVKELTRGLRVVTSPASEANIPDLAEAQVAGFFDAL